MKRKKWIDVLKVGAIISVILLHVMGNTINTFLLDGTPRKVYEILIALLNTCIPIFLMISGYLFLDPKREISFKDMLKKYVTKIFLAIVIFGAIFSLMEEYYVTKTFSLETIKAIFLRVINSETWSHMWYLYMILIIYLLTPFLKRFSFDNKKETTELLVVLCALSLGIETLNRVPNINIVTYIPISFYLFYYVLGYFLGHFDTNVKFKYLTYILGVISTIIVVLNGVFEWNALSTTYSALYILPIASSIFILAKEHISKKENKLVESIATCSLGIYILHQVVINFVYKVFEFRFIVQSPYLGLIIYTSVIFFITYMSVYVFRKFKIGRRLL